MKKKINKPTLALLKTKALELRRKFQLPYKLVYYIYQLTPETDKSIYQFLMQCSEHYLRVAGYYKKYPAVAKECDAIIEKQYIALAGQGHKDSTEDIN